MTQQDDITQRVLTDAEIQALWDEACKDSPQAPGWNRHIRFARALLSKVPAPIADSTLRLEQALHELIDKIVPGLDTGDLVQDARRASTALSATLASAPVAGEAQPVAWFIDWPDEPELGHYIAESPAANGRSRPLVFADAVPQPSEPVYAYRRKGLDDFVTCDRERFDELSAKPRLFETRIFYAAPQASEAVRTHVLAALESAQRFIRNGIEFGYIRMPDADTPDPAHRTPGLIDAAIRSLKSQADKDGGQQRAGQKGGQ